MKGGGVKGGGVKGGGVKGEQGRSAQHLTSLRAVAWYRMSHSRYMFTPLSRSGRGLPSLLYRSGPHALSRSGPGEEAGPQSPLRGSTTGAAARLGAPRCGQKEQAQHLHHWQWCVSLGLHQPAQPATLASLACVEVQAI